MQSALFDAQTLKPAEWWILATLLNKPSDRLVHQLCGALDDDGVGIFPESVFLRNSGGGRFLAAFRRLAANGLLSRVSAESGDNPQDEYQLSAFARARFRDCPYWQAADRVWGRLKGAGAEVVPFRRRSTAA